MSGSKRSAAIHEAGHAVVAQFLGCRLVWCRIKEDQGEWIGDTSWVLGPNSAWPVVGLAGVVAEAIERDPDVTSGQILIAIKEKALRPSASDWENIVELQCGDIEKCIDAIKENRQWVERIAEHLATHESLDNEISAAWPPNASPFPFF